MKRAGGPVIETLTRDFHITPITISRIVPESLRSGAPVAFYPWERFPNRQGLSLHVWGEGPFCRFRIPERYRKHTGAYLFTRDRQIVFIGWCQDLARRINQHYGTISPRRCFEERDIENCYINNSIYHAINDGCLVTLYFIPDVSEETVREMISHYSPEWNRELSDTCNHA